MRRLTEISQVYLPPRLKLGLLPLPPDASLPGPSITWASIPWVILIPLNYSGTLNYSDNFGCTLDS